MMNVRFDVRILSIWVSLGVGFAARAGEETLPVGCLGLDEVALTVSPFPGGIPPDPLPTEPFTVANGDLFGVVVEVGELGNNAGVILLVTLDNNTINGDTGDLFGFAFPEGGDTFVWAGSALGKITGTYYFAATLISSDSAEMGCASISQVYNEDVSINIIPDCEGDANRDGLVDPLDAGFVLSRIGCDPAEDGEGCMNADVNADGLVDPLDVGFVLARLGQCL